MCQNDEETNMDEKLAQLRRMRKHELLALWQEQFTDPSPRKCSPDQLRWEVAWRIQVRKSGDLSKRTTRRLRALAKSYQSNSNHLPHSVTRLSPGTTLTRKWQETTYIVQVLESGFMHEGVQYKTLSSVARAITGTRWSGPAFFGLKTKQAPQKVIA